MNYIVCILTLFICLPAQFFGMNTTFYKPTYWHEKPRFDRKNMTTYELTYSYAWASKSFNKDGDKAPLLAFSNPEPLLPSFINTKVDCKDNKPIAYAIFDGKFSENTITNEFIQNLHQHFFIQVNFPITNAYLKNISITPTNACGNSIESNSKIDSYIEKLSLKLFDGCSKNTQSASIIGPSFLLFGFIKSFTNFNHLDMLDFEFKTGFVIPVISLKNCGSKEHNPSNCNFNSPNLISDLNNQHFSLFPRTSLQNFGIPFQLKCMIGAYDWFNFGVSATVVLHLKKDHTFEINQCPYPNKLIIPTSTMASLLHHPFMAFTTYFEGEHFLPHWTWYVGFNFVKQYKTVWDICSGTSEENHIANKFPALAPWQQGAITISSEIDFSSEEKKCMPRLKIIYVKRLFGKSCFDTSVISGQAGFELLYDF